MRGIHWKAVGISGFVLGMGLVARAAVEPCEIRLSMQQGERVQELRYCCRDQQVRIDHPGKIIPSPPINLLDLETGMLSIIHPHNGTWEQGTVAGIADPVSPASAVPGSQIPATGATPRMAPPADWPEMPQGLPSGIGPGAAQASPSATMVPGMPAGMPGGMPSFPAMPDFPMAGMGGDKPLALVSQNQTNELFGFSCRLHEVALPRHGTLLLWLCDDPALPPFHLLAHEIHRRQGRSEWDEQVAQLLRKEKMFPFHAVLKGEGDAVLAEWSVLSIRTDVEEKDQEDLFEVPAGLHFLPSVEWE